jgi:FHA domain-containing protein
VDRPDGFIVPPPGLLPEPKQESDSDTPRRTGETTESYPAFFPRAVGVAPAARRRRGTHAADDPVADASTSNAEPTEAVIAPWTLTMPDGTRVPIEQATVIGRNPTPTPDAPGAVLRALADPQRSLSKSHALLVPSSGTLLVTDLFSTNGVAIIGKAGQVVAEPGVPTPAMDGSELAIGKLRIRVSGA